MKTDPDFHPAAAAWLDGRADPPQQLLLQEILAAEPDPMPEFAALCHMEVLLQQTTSSSSVRRKNLEDLLTPKTRPILTSRFSSRRIAGWAAMAAVLALVFSVVWLTKMSSEDESQVGFDSATARQVAVRMRTGSPLGTGAPPAAPEGDPQLRRVLERTSVIPFKAEGSLTEMVAKLREEVNAQHEVRPPIRVLTEGDAPVFLNIDALMPAWHLLEIMALQTGTSLTWEDGALTFRTDPQAASRRQLASGKSTMTSLRALLGLFEKDKDPDLLGKYENLTKAALGIDCAFRKVSGDVFEFSGTAREVKVLESAIRAAAASPLKADLTIALVSVPPEFDLQYIAVLTRSQYGELVRGSLGRGRTLFKALPNQTMVSNQEYHAGIEGTVNGERLKMDNRIICRSRQSDVDIEVVIDISSMTADGSENTSSVKTKLQMWYGQIAFFGTVRQPDGSKGALFVSPIRNSGELSSATVATAAEREAQPVTGKPGFVTSPYSDIPLEIDVSSFTSGEYFSCPFTGKRFFIP